MEKTAQPTTKPNYCFACGVDNLQGMHLKFSIDPEGPVVRGRFRFTRRYSGPPSALHGGIIATIVDEAMGKLSRVDGIIALTAELNVQYLRPVPLGRTIIVEARPGEHHGRSYSRECTISDENGTVLVRSKGRFVKIAARDQIIDYD